MKSAYSVIRWTIADARGQMQIDVCGYFDDAEEITEETEITAKHRATEVRKT
jgi:hypothetical protein